MHFHTCSQDFCYYKLAEVLQIFGAYCTSSLVTLLVLPLLAWQNLNLITSAEAVRGDGMVIKEHQQFPTSQVFQRTPLQIVQTNGQQPIYEAEKSTFFGTNTSEFFVSSKSSASTEHSHKNPYQFWGFLFL